MIMLQEITRRYGERFVLKGVNYHFPSKGRVALVGVNGAGKSTLLNIICKLDEADSGQMIQPKSCVLGYLPQEPNPTPEPTLLQECMASATDLNDLRIKLEAALVEMCENYTDEVYARYEKLEHAFRDQGGYALEAEAKSILVGLGFRTDQFDQSPLDLSGGWRMRLELARIFIRKPNFLVLDEPTNHLDLPSMMWLESYLLNFEGTLLLVSHDQELLNRLSTHTLHLQAGQLTPYVGNFDAFLQQHELRKMQSSHGAKQMAAQQAHIEKFIERFRGKPSKAAQVRSRYKMLGRLQALEQDTPEQEEDAAMSLNLPIKVKSGLHVLKVLDASIGYGDRVLAKRVNLEIKRGQKVAIIGANGIGKSTLLKSIVGVCPFLAGTCEQGHQVKLGYYAQNQMDTLNGNLTVLDNVMTAREGLSIQEGRRILGCFLFTRDDVFKPLKVLSGGEKSRVGLAHLLAQECNLLVLDEPTNHLDMMSTNILANSLSEYEGTALFVSHNRAFINAVATHIFAMTPDGRSQLFEGNLDDYVHLCERSKFPNVLKGN